MKAGEIHIGKLIQEVVEKQNLTIAEFGRRINKSRPSVYHLFGSKSVDSELLLNVSLTLDVNFFLHYIAFLPDENSSGNTKSLAKIEELEKELQLKNKMIALLEEKIERQGH